MEIEVVKTIINSFYNTGTPLVKAAELVDKMNLNGCLEEALNYLHFVYINSNTIDEDLQDDEDNLTIPDIAWQGVFRKYRDLMCQTTEASDNFHWATCLTALGITLNRKVSVDHAGIKYPNFYTALIGSTGNARKDTAWKRGKVILTGLHTGNNESFGIIYGFGSAEGLADECSGEKRVRLLISMELSSLMSKAEQKSSGSAIPMLTEFYDCPDQYNPKLRGKVVNCIEPFLSIFAASTPEWLYKSLALSDIHGGFANRWIYIPGKNKGPMPNPLQIDCRKKSELLEDINGIREWASKLPDNGLFKISIEAEHLFSLWYQDYYQRTQLEGLIPELSVRIQDQVWKIALLYAAQECSNTIEAKHLETALSIGDFLERGLKLVFKNFNTSNSRKDEDRVVRYLKRGPQITRDMCRNLNLSASELTKILDPLKKIGRVQEVLVTKQSKEGKLIKGQGYKLL